MSSFFTAPGKRKRSVTFAEGPRKRPAAPSAASHRPAIAATPKKHKSRPASNAAAAAALPSKKRKAAERESSQSESELDSSDSSDHGRSDGADGADEGSDDDSDNEGETAAEKRLRLAQRYLDKTRKEVDDLGVGFDAKDIDRDLIAERLQEDAAESKGKVYRQLAAELNFAGASHVQWRWNSASVTSVSVCPPYAYTATKDGFLTKWRLQDLPKDQWPQTTKKKPKRQAPPKSRPERVCYNRGGASLGDHAKNKNSKKGSTKDNKARDKSFQGHTGGALLCCRASPDGHYVVSGGTDRRLVVHRAEDLRPIRAFAHHRDAVTSLVFRRSTNQLFSASRDRTVKVWSLDELAYTETLFGHQDDVVDVDALAQERCVTVGARDRTARYWKVPEESQLVFRGGGSGGGDDAPSKKRRKHDSDPKTPSSEPTIDPLSAAHEGSMDRVAMVDDELFVTGSDNGALMLWSTQKKKALFVYPRAHGIEPPLDLATYLAEAGADSEPRVPPAGEKDAKMAKALPPPQPRWITALRTVPYSDVILSGSWDGYVRVWRLSADKRRIEAVGVLGGVAGASPVGDGAVKMNGDAKHGHEDEEGESTKDKQAKDAKKSGLLKGQKPATESMHGPLVKGIINDIALFERGDRGRDGLCVVIGTGKEMRLGRWKTVKDGRCGAMVFEVPRIASAAALNGEKLEPKGNLDEVATKEAGY